MGLSNVLAKSSELLDLVYPPRCFACSEETDQPHGLCGPCWAQTSFVSGTCCETCGVPLPGDTAPFICDACLTYPPPWSMGRAALLYNGGGKKLTLAFKHSDRTDMAKPLSQWLLRAGPEVLDGTDLLTAVPLHWSRLFKRGFNQSALLASKLGKLSGVPVQPDLLQRIRATPTQEGLNRTERFENQKNAIRLHPKHKVRIAGKTITLVDDVLTTGGTLTACASQLLSAGAKDIRVLVLARVAREA